jgi:hypothetical protein
MDDRRPESTIAAIREWQRNPRVHPLRCGHEVRHRPLEAHAEGDQVLLRCPDCDYVQRYIPASVLHAFWKRALERH